MGIERIEIIIGKNTSPDVVITHLEKGCDGQEIFCGSSGEIFCAKCGHPVSIKDNPRREEHPASEEKEL